MKVGKEGRSERWREGGEVNVLKCVLCVSVCEKERQGGGGERKTEGREDDCVYGGEHVIVCNPAHMAVTRQPLVLVLPFYLSEKSLL